MKMSQKYRSTPGGCSENSKELETRNRHIHEFLLFCLIFLASGPKNHKKKPSQVKQQSPQNRQSKASWSFTRTKISVHFNFKFLS